MAESIKYKNYFRIDESFKPAINLDTIENDPEVWKSYYPHESFVRLLKQAISVLTRQQKLSIWVEGAYGTGKSHAVLTLKKLLDANAEETKEYFDKYDVLTKDLYNTFVQIKSQPEKILTVHRYGSSSIKNDNNLTFAIQESILAALKANGYDQGKLGLKQAIIDWLSVPHKSQYFNSLITGPYRAKFNGETAETVLNNLKNYTSREALLELINKITYVAEEEQIKMLTLSTSNLKNWLVDVIDKNNLKAIVFIWDEFSDFFDNNKKNLTGFQEIVEISENYPFYMLIVTHKSEAFFGEVDKDKNKIFDRFVKPLCTIELPENMAFTLMGHAMKKNTSDTALMKEWNEDITCTLYDETHESRNAVMKRANIGEKELKDIIPIHPYAALILKHISSAYDSNQRSMFDFIKNDRGEEIKGFQWFINKVGPYDNNPLLTVDMLWDFFYEKGKEQLSPQVRNILDSYGRAESHNLNRGEKAVLKTILLLQAISEKVNDKVELFIPNEKNLKLAMEGGEFFTSCLSHASTLEREQIIFKRPIGGGQFKYSAFVSNANQEEINKLKDKFKLTLTSKLIEESGIADEFNLPKYLEIRYVAKHVSIDNLKQTINAIRNDSMTHPTRLYAVFTYAKDESDEIKIDEELKKYVLDENNNNIIFVDYSMNTLGIDAFSQYVENMANAEYQQNKDKNQARQYVSNAQESLKRWKSKLRISQCNVVYYSNQIGSRCNTLEELFALLKEIDRRFFEYSLETHYSVIDNMYAQNNLRLGAACGISQECKLTFRSLNENTKLENQLKDAWRIEDYWLKSPNLIISKIKARVEEVIAESFDKNKRVSITNIYDALKEAPYGFMPCNLVAFVLGFVLKEYANEVYNWSDELNTEPMNPEKLATMIEGVIKNAQTPNPKYREMYIETLSDEQRKFNAGTAIAFGIDEKLCSSIENTRNRIRNSMISFKFPIWTLKYILAETDTLCSSEVISKVLDDYVLLANNGKASESETDIALAIGKLYIDNDELPIDLKNLLSADNCVKGMKAYLKLFEGGKLISLANEIGDSGNYISALLNKFDANASNWVWNKDTVDSKIHETITEYEIIFESNKILTKTCSFAETINEWAIRCDNIRVAYLSAKNYIGELADFLEILYQIKKNGYIYDNSKQIFLELLKSKLDSFKYFYENQIEVLKKIGTFYFTGLSNEDIAEISKSLFGVFTKENSEFVALLDEKVKGYKASLSKYKLRALWKEKTGTETPIEWSRTYVMPVVCMFDEEEEVKARLTCALINSPIDDNGKINDAIEFLKTSHCISKLVDEKYRDEAFRTKFLKTYAVILTDINEVKSELKTHLTEEPFNWLGSASAERLLSDIAYHKYNNGGSKLADEIVDTMNPQDLKDYIKKLIKENMAVGIEIIKTKK